MAGRAVAWRCCFCVAAALAHAGMKHNGAYLFLQLGNMRRPGKVTGKLPHLSGAGADGPPRAWSRRPQRLAALLAGALAVAALVALAVYAVGRREAQTSLSQLEVRLNGRSTANINILVRQMEDLRRDVHFLASVPPMTGIVRATGNHGFDAEESTPLALWERRLERIFSAYAEARPDIFQVRLIGVAKNGRELIRVERRGDGVVAVPAAQLQEKGDTDYMRQTVRLAAGQTYLSDLNLNREHDKVQMPPQATLRAATPVYDRRGVLFGILVLNYDVNSIMSPLRANMPPDFRAYLVNGAGDFLLHPDAARSYGFDLGRRWRWQDEFRPAEAERHLPTNLQRYTTANGMVYAAERRVVLDPEAPQRDLRYVLTADDDEVLGAEGTARSNLLAAMLAGALVVGAAGYLYLRQRRKVYAYQARLSAIVENSVDAIIGKTLDGVVTSWNHGAEQMLGYSAEEALGQPLLALIVPPDGEPGERAAMAGIAAGGGAHEFSATRRRKDGGMLAVSVLSSPIRTADGRLVGVAETVRDISAQVAASRRINELNATLEDQVRERTRQIESVTMLQRAILAHASYAIIATDTEGLIQLFNPAAERMLGYSAGELLGRRTPAILHDAGEVRARAAALSRELGREVEAGFEVFVAKARLGLDDENEWTYVRKDGSRFLAMLSVSALRGEDGAVNGYLGISSDVSAREEDRRKLVAARDQLQNAADVAELGIWTWTLAGDQIEWNDRMYQLYGVAPELRHTGLDVARWRACVHPDDVEEVVAKLGGVLDGSAAYDPVFRIRRPDGELRYVQGAASVERDAAGRPVRVLGINRDITVQHEAEEVLRLAKRSADGANQAKSEFLANMSHEIRSPMNAVLGMLALLKQTALDARQLDYAGKAEGAGRTLLAILNDILDFSRVEAGKLALDPQPFSIDRLLREAAVILSANVGAKDIEILYEIDPALPDRVVGDAMRLQQVLLNLAGNAVKFTERGEVALAVRLCALSADELARHGAQALGLGFAIRDTGIGIAPQQCQRIFEGFSQAEASTARRYGGSGLGLAISQRLVSLMHGTIEVASTPGQGSVFSFHIVCQPAEPAEPVARGGVRAQQLRCLLVDDNAHARAAMGSMLQRFGWQVDTATGGAQALALIERDDAPRHDVLFLDWSMPDMDGWETGRRIERMPAERRPAVIVTLSAHQREAFARCQELGQTTLSTFVVKPVTASMLFDAAAQALAASAAPDAPVSAPGRRPLAGVRLLLVEDNPINQQVAQELLSNAGAIVQTADDGRAAIAAVRHASPPFDCVLMDVQMPAMDGYAATRIIRRRLRQRELPIVAMTANVMDSDRALAFAAGMNDHVGKPFDLDQLIATILRHIGRAAPAPGPAPAPGAAGGRRALPLELRRPGLNGAGALARFSGNVLFYRRALEHFAAEVAALPAPLGADGTPARTAPTAAALHSLKGLAGTVGAEQLAEAAQRMEGLLRADGGTAGDGDTGGGVDSANASAGSVPASVAEAEWARAHVQLLEAGRQAARSAAELAAELLAAEAPPAPRAPADGQTLAARLELLRRQLAESNLDALALFEQLRYDLGERPPDGFADLNEAIERFDFALAVRCCEAILRQLPAAAT
ncbi:hybrid sensor histidine kinase/response regulator [Janthinobacterium sp. BJB412]|nr:hybrid sensor histidine kinase/response regulator [Janthinobacterium sp. BJB412]